MHRAKLALALIATVIGITPGWAHVLLLNSGTGGIWDTAQVEISFMFGPSPVLLDGSTWNSSAQAALDEWNRHMTVLQLASTIGSGTVGGSQNGRNEAFFSPTVYGQSFGPNAAATTIIRSSGIPARNTEADVIFNTAFSWDSYRGPLRNAGGQMLPDFRRVALHEFGHVLGLGHADMSGAAVGPAMMNAALSDLDHLADDDIAGVRLLFGPGEAPAYTDQSNLNVVAALGGSQLITFYSAGGTPYVGYQLHRNGAVLRTFYAGGNYLGSFTVNFDSPSDFGTYQIVASNRVGQVHGKIFNFPSDPVTYAPAITTDLHDVTLGAGEARQFGVIASGNPAPTFAWFKDGVQLTGQTGPSLRLQGATAETGTYEVVVTNAVGSRRSSASKVTVLPAAAASNTWTTVAPGLPPVRVEACAFGNGVFVAVGDNGNVLTSSDGMAWKHGNIGSTASLCTIVFAADRFVAGGIYDRKTARTPIYVSSDGVGWRPAESGMISHGLIVSIAHGAGRFVAADLDGSILTSSDGLNWQAGSWKVPTGDFPNALAFGNGVFVLTGRKGKVWVSADGRTWMERNSGVASGLKTITFGAGRFVAAGAYPDTRIDKAYIAISTDGATWTTSIAQSIGGGGPQIYFLNGRFHLTSAKEHLVSADGSSWEQRNFTQKFASLMSHGNGIYVALGIFGEAFTSANGLHWTCTAPDSSRYSSVAYINGRFLLFGSNLFNGGLSSVDGISWQPMQIAGSHYNAAAYGGGHWVAVAGSVGSSSSGSRYIARSTDGQAWTEVMDPMASNPAAIAYGAGRFVTVGEKNTGGNGGVAHSVDGAAWTESFPSAEPLRGIVHGPAGFVAVGRNGTLLHSLDGLAWQARPTGTTRTLWSVACHAGIYIAVGGTGNFGTVRVRGWDEPFDPDAVVCRSTDGINWTSQLLPFEEPLYSITHLDGTWIAGGLGGLLLFSTDGITWVEGPRANRHLWRLAAGEGMVVGTDTGFPSTAVRLPASALTKTVCFGIPPSVKATATGVTVSFESNAPSLQQVQWFRGASSVAQSTGTSSSLAAPVVRGIYFAEIRTGDRTTSRLPVVIAPGGTNLASGEVTQVRAGVRHSNGNLYDQYLLTGASAQLRARPGIVTRVSFRDLSEDIVQVEFSGSGVLTIDLENASAPGRAPNYNQEVDYVKGHARIFISDADETTNVSVFSVGSLTAVDQSLFKGGVAYDGIADIGLLAIHSRNGRFGGVRLGNASIWNRTDVTGFWAPDTTFVGPIVLGDLSGFDTAVSGLVVRQANSVTIAGGDLEQANGGAVSVDGTPSLKFSAGTDSHGRELPGQRNQARFSKNGEDVTVRMVPPQ